MFMEDEGSPSPGIMTLTTSLSNPFRRLDKYPVLLKELERHIEVSIVIIDCAYAVLLDMSRCFENTVTTCYIISCARKVQYTFLLLSIHLLLLLCILIEIEMYIFILL